MSTIFRRSLFYSTAAGLCAALSATVAVAQTAATAQVEEIVVTGSRLTSGFNQPTPVTVLGGEELAKRAPANVLEVINSLPSARPTSTTGGNVRNSTTQAGIQGTVDLRGLGPGRTLVLVDGQRWVPGGFTGVPDTNMFPVSLIERIDVVTGGASAAYGSEAVAGVANFILNDRLEGLRGSIQYGQSSYDDLQQVIATIGGGMSFADGRFHLVGAFDYGDNKGGDSIYSRPWGANEPLALGTGAVGTANRPAGTPSQIFALGVERNDGAPGGLIVAGPLKGTTFDANGNPMPFVYGRAYGTSMTGSTANYRFNPQGFTTVANPFNRRTAYAKLTYDVSDETSVWASVNLGRVRDRSYGGPPWAIGPFNITLDNPYIPATTRAAMVAAGQTSISVSKFINVLGKTGGISQTKHVFEMYRLAAGARGKLGRFDWDAYATIGETTEPYTVPFGAHVANIASAVYAVRDASGNIVCGPTATNPYLTAATRPLAQQGCVTLNLFGVTPAGAPVYDYITNPIEAEIVTKQSAAGVNLRGELFEMPAGAISFAVGAEARWDELSQWVDPLAAAGAYSQSNQTAYSGKNNVQEAYVEAGVPLARDMGPMLKALDVTGAARVTRYELGGRVETWKVGGTYAVNDMLRARVSRSRDIRAPNLYDQVGLLPGMPFLGINSPFTNVNGTVFSAVVGNPTLVPEKADTLTAGLVFQPTGFLSGFRASVDYFDIRIKDVIAQLSVQDVLNGCRAGNTQYCSTITFDSANPLGVSIVNRQPANLLELQTDGYDIELSYRKADLPFPGAVNIRFLGTITENMKVGSSTGVIDYAGSGLTAPAGGGVPKYRGTLDIEYSLSRVRTTVQFSGFNSMLANPTLIGPDSPSYNPNLANSISKNKFPGAVYVNWNGSVDLGTRVNAQFFWSINNLLDKRPPEFAIVAFAFGSANYYDMVGRYSQAGLRFSF